MMQGIMLQAGRLTLGALLLLSGLLKANDPWGFSFKLEEYFTVFNEHLGLPTLFLRHYSLAIAVVICVLELALAYGILMKTWYKRTLISTLVLLSFFTLLTGYSALTNSVTDCGCFGDALKITPWQSFGKDILLISILIFVYTNSKEQMKRVPKWIHAGYPLIITICLIQLNYEPFVDFRPFRIGQDIGANLKMNNKDGLPAIKDYITSSEFCKVDELRGDVIIIAIRRWEPEEASEHIKAIRNLKTENISIVAMTSLGKAEREKISKDIGHCVAPQDDTILKTMIRHKIGYMKLKNGVIIKKSLSTPT